MSIDRAPDRSESPPRPSAAWPVPGAGLVALVDLGLSIAEIARYFSVEPAAVRDRLGAVGRQAP